ncbi:serine/threonine protein kinase [Clostridium sp. YIM B02505]|uniref:Serine/threonine protein kinase n=1 Tax=Clostridium yunnanense TaxID=2800325 RepID=A0ABS1ENY1_9CLOT|nr:serine/threonine-protein kinase [Clostridium yunnanense]MBK1811117.1 serine/threonine protein kinase [Clostridium yunnanense]
MLEVGYVLDDKYEVIKIIGSGGMGTVYLCKNIRLENLWAIKETEKYDNVSLDILSECNILKNLNHSGIPRIVDIFYEKNYVYLVEDYVEGKTLFEYVKNEQGVELENIKTIILEISEIIEYLHSLNPPIIYRDLKPSNIIINPSGKVFLVDFGISKFYKVDSDSDTICMGSSGYAAPEQHGLAQSCKQTDIYGMGMVIYFMITGKVPFSGAEPLFDENYDKNINKDFIRIIKKCVQPEIKDRYTSVYELKKEVIELSINEEDDKTTLLKGSNEKVKKMKKKFSIKKIFLIIPFFVILVLSSIYLLGESVVDNDNEINKSNIENTVKSVPEATKETNEQNQNNTSSDATSDSKLQNQVTDDTINKQTLDSQETIYNQHKAKGNGKKKK